MPPTCRRTFCRTFLPYPYRSAVFPNTKTSTRHCRCHVPNNQKGDCQKRSLNQYQYPRPASVNNDAKTRGPPSMQPITDRLVFNRFYYHIPCVSISKHPTLSCFSAHGCSSDLSYYEMAKVVRKLLEMEVEEVWDLHCPRVVHTREKNTGNE